VTIGSKSNVKFLIFIFFLSFIFRAVIFMFLINKDDNAWIYPDSAQYYSTAVNVVHGNGFTDEQGQPQMYRLPGYPMFLAAGMKLFGDNTTAILWLQLLLSCLIPLLVFLLAGVLFHNDIIARIAAVIAAVHVGFGIYAGMISTETLFLIFFLLFFIVFFRGKSLKSLFLAGMVLGIASLIRPVGHYTLAVSSVLLLFERASCMARAKKMCCLSAGWLLIILPWLVRNFLLTGALFFHTLPGHHFLQYSAAYVVMERDHSEYGDVRPVLLAQWDDAIKKQEAVVGRPLHDYERCAIAESLAVNIMKQHPWYTIKTAGIQILKTCCSLYTAQPLLSDAYQWPQYTKDTSLCTKIKRFLLPQVHHTLLIPLIYWEILLFIFMIMGFMFFCCASLFNTKILRVAYTTFPYIFLFIIITLGYGCARLRFPIEPLIIIFSGAGWLWMYGLMQRKKNIF